jgi:hypothetical protein
MQSALLWQVVLHAPMPQLYGTQLEVGAGAQLPTPVQREIADSVEPVQVIAPQATVLAACVHAPAPLQVPVFPHGGLGVQAASELPTGALAHVPRLPVTLQDWQVGQLPTPQQMPSVQNPDAHSFAAVHVVPVAFLPRQLPPGPVQ